MIPIVQTLYGNWQGNCWTACLASILEYPVEKIPNFFVLYKNSVLMRTTEWLNENFGLGIISVRVDRTYPISHTGLDFLHTPCYHIISGLYENEIGHSVVGYKGRIVHDPFPTPKPMHKIISYEFIVKTNPSLERYDTEKIRSFLKPQTVEAEEASNEYKAFRK